MQFDLMTLLSAHPIILLFKFSMAIILILYLLFLLVVLKQVRSMNIIVTQPYLFPYLQTFALGLIAFTVSLLVLALVIL